MQPRPKHAPRRSDAGFSLVELLVAIVLGMMAVLVVMQTLLASDLAQRRTVSADTAQAAGASAMFLLQHELRQAGAGIGDPRLLGCELALGSGWSAAPLAPVAINPPGIPAGDPMTDTLLVMYGSDAGLPQGTAVSAQPGPNAYAVASPGAFAVGDQMIGWSSSAGAAPGCQLRMLPVTAVSAAMPVVVQAPAPLAASMSDGVLFNMGRHPRLLAFAVRNGRLTQCDFLLHDCRAAAGLTDPDVWVDMTGGIVSLRAQYGATHGSAADAPVDTYGQDLPADGCGWIRTPVLRLAVVARSAQPEKEPVAQAPLTWSGAAQAPISLAPATADWDHYHYRTYETTVPLRNIAWRQRSASC